MCVQIYPSFIVQNQCVDTLTVNNIGIEPFKNIEAYFDPAADFTLHSVKYCNFSAVNVLICKWVVK